MRNSSAVKEQLSVSGFRSIHIFWHSIATSWPIESNGQIQSEAFEKSIISPPFLRQNSTTRRKVGQAEIIFTLGYTVDELYNHSPAPQIDT